MTNGKQNKAKALLGIIILILLILSFQQYSYYLRIPILGSVFLVLLPAISRSSLLRSLFIFRYKWQIAIVIVAAMIAGLATANTFDTIIVDGPIRFNFESHQPPVWKFFQEYLSGEKSFTFTVNKVQIQIELFKDILAILLGSFICITAVIRSKNDNEFSRYVNNNNIPDHSKQLWSGALLGSLIGLVLIFFADISTSILTYYLQDKNSSYIEEQVIALTKFLLREGTRGYLTEDGKLTPSHLSNLGFLLVIALFYIGSYYIGNFIWERSQKNKEKIREEEPFAIPALFYLFLLTAGFILLFGVLTFCFDYYLVPVLLAFLVLSVSIYWIFKVDHYYDYFQPNFVKV